MRKLSVLVVALLLFIISAEGTEKNNTQMENDEIRVSIDWSSCELNSENNTSSENACFIDITVLDKLSGINYRMPIKPFQLKRYLKVTDLDFDSFMQNPKKINLFKKMIRDYDVTTVMPSDNSVSAIPKEKKNVNGK